MNEKDCSNCGYYFHYPVYKKLVKWEFKRRWWFMGSTEYHEFYVPVCPRCAEPLTDHLFRDFQTSASKERTGE